MTQLISSCQAIDFQVNDTMLMPAEFLIDFDGKVFDLWYGSDVSDHIPIDRIEKFAHKVKLVRVTK